MDLDEAWAFLNVAQGETLSNKLVRAGRAMNAGVYFVTQSSGDVSKESLKNNIGLKFAFRSTDTNEIKPVSYTHLDNTNIYAYLAMLGLSCVGLGGMLYFKRRRKKS